MTVFGNINIFQCDTCNFSLPTFNKKKKGENKKINKVDTDDVMFEVPNPVYEEVGNLQHISNDITDIMIFSNQLHYIFVYGEKPITYNIDLKDVRNKLTKHIMPVDHQRKLEDTLLEIKKSRKHIQKIYCYGKKYQRHDYFPIIDKLNNLIGILLLIRDTDPPQL